MVIWAYQFLETGISLPCLLQYNESKVSAAVATDTYWGKEAKEKTIKRGEKKTFVKTPFLLFMLPSEYETLTFFKV